MPNAFDTVVEFIRTMNSSSKVPIESGWPGGTVYMDTKSPIQKFIERAKPSLYQSPMTITPSHQQNPPAGLIQYGNIDLQTRPRTNNPDGSQSSVRSSSFTDQFGRNILVPTVSDGGRIMSDAEAWQRYQQTGKHLGIFQTPDHADLYANTLHKDYEDGKIPGYPSTMYSKPIEGYELDAARRGVSTGYDVPMATLPPLNRK